jgi:Rod binding domain-containing protein
MSTVAPKVGSYHDFQGLGELRGQAQRREGGALREAAQQFEAMFIQQIMKTMRESSFKGAELFDSQALDTYQAMHDKEISLHMARRGSFGLADMLVKSMERQEQSVPAADALAARMRELGDDGAKRAGATGSAKGAFPVERARGSLPLSVPGAPALPLPKAPEPGFKLQRDMLLPGAGFAPARGK